MFTIKQASEILNISPHALRFYDNVGLLPGLSKRNKHRLFSYEDLEWVRNIQCWRESGMPVADIKRYSELLEKGESTFAERFQMIRDLREKTIQDVKQAKERLKLMERKVKWYQALERGENPEQFRPDMQKIVKKALKRIKSDKAKKAG